MKVLIDVLYALISFSSVIVHVPQSLPFFYFSACLSICIFFVCNDYVFIFYLIVCLQKDFPHI